MSPKRPNSAHRAYFECATASPKRPEPKYDQCSPPLRVGGWARNPQYSFGPSWSVRQLAAPRSMGPAVFLGSPPTHSTLKTAPTNCESHLRHNDLDTKMPTIHRSTQVVSELIASKQLKDPQSKQQLSSTRRCLKRARTPFSRVVKRTSVTRNSRRDPRSIHGKTCRQPRCVSRKLAEHFRRIPDPSPSQDQPLRTEQQNPPRLLLELWHAAQCLYTAPGWRSGHNVQGTTPN